MMMKKAPKNCSNLVSRHTDYKRRWRENSHF